MTIFFKLPPNGGHLSITEKFLKTRRCPLFSGFTVFVLLDFFKASCQGVLIRNIKFRSSHPEVFLRKYVLEICSKFTGEHPYRSAISIKLQSNFTEITLRHGCSPVNLLYIFRTPFY